MESANEDKKRFLEDQKPIADALRRAGLCINHIGDLNYSRLDYTAQVPLIVEHLQRDYPEDIKDSLVHSLGFPGARAAWPQLVQMYRESGPSFLHDSLASTLSFLGTSRQIDDLIDLVQDKRMGPSRALLIIPLYRSKKPEARQVIESLVDEPDCQVIAVDYLKKWDKRDERAAARRNGATER